MPQGRSRTARAQITVRILSALLVCLASTNSPAQKTLTVYAVNYPLQYFAERIAGEAAAVVLPVPADVDPAFWAPDSDAVAGFQQADLILLNGAGYARWLDRVSLPRRKLVNTSAAFRERYIETEAPVTHSHGREGAHSHAGTAFTTWLDFAQAAQQARAVLDALVRLRPEHEERFTARYQALERDLLELDARLREIAARHPAQPLLASHPVYQYLARRYRLNLESVMWEPDALPTEAEWEALEVLLAEHPARWMLWEDQPLAESVARLESLGVGSVTFSPGASHPAGHDFLGTMRQNVDNLSASL